MNREPSCCTQVPLDVMWPAVMLRGWGKPWWYHEPCQLSGIWQSEAAASEAVHRRGRRISSWVVATLFIELVSPEAAITRVSKSIVFMCHRKSQGKSRDVTTRKVDDLMHFQCKIALKEQGSALQVLHTPLKLRRALYAFIHGIGWVLTGFFNTLV